MLWYRSFSMVSLANSLAIMTLVIDGGDSGHTKECSEVVSVTMSAVESRSKLKGDVDSNTEQTFSSIIIGR